MATVLESFPSGGLPAPGQPGRIARVTDRLHGVVVDENTGWVPLTRVYRPEWYDPTMGPTATAAVNQAAIQAAMDAAEAAGGGVVVLPPGRISVNGLMQGHNVMIDGSMGAVLVQPTPTGQTNVSIVQAKGFATTGTIATGSRTLTVASSANLLPGAAARIRAAGGRSINLATTLVAPLLALDATGVVTVNNTAGFPPNGWLQIDNELLAYTGISPTTFTGVTRAALGTAAADHATGTSIGMAKSFYTTVESVSGTTVVIEDAAPVGVTSSAVEWGPVGPAVYRVRFDGAKTSDASTGGYPWAGVEWCKVGQGRLIDCHFTSLPASAVVFDIGCQDSEIRGCTARNCGSPSSNTGFSFALFRGARRCRIEGNNVIGRFFIGIGIDNRTNTPTEYDGVCSQNLIAHNTIMMASNTAGTNHQGIDSESGVENRIIGNLITGITAGTSDAIDLAAPVSQKSADGAAEPSTGNVLMGNVVDGASSYGIGIDDSGLVTNNIVMGNVLLNCAAWDTVCGPVRPGTGWNLIAGNAPVAKPGDAIGLFSAASGLKIAHLATASLPAAAALQDGRVVIEDTAAGANLIVYAHGQRFRFTGASF